MYFFCGALGIYWCSIYRNNWLQVEDSAFSFPVPQVSHASNFETSKPLQSCTSSEEHGVCHAALWKRVEEEQQPTYLIEVEKWEEAQTPAKEAVVPWMKFNLIQNMVSWTLCSRGGLVCTPHAFQNWYSSQKCRFRHKNISSCSSPYVLVEAEDQKWQCFCGNFIWNISYLSKMTESITECFLLQLEGKLTQR